MDTKPDALLLITLWNSNRGIDLEKRSNSKIRDSRRGSCCVHKIAQHLSLGSLSFGGGCRSNQFESHRLPVWPPQGMHGGPPEYAHDAPHLGLFGWRTHSRFQRVQQCTTAATADSLRDKRKENIHRQISKVIQNAAAIIILCTCNISTHNGIGWFIRIAKKTGTAGVHLLLALPQQCWPCKTTSSPANSRLAESLKSCCARMTAAAAVTKRMRGGELGDSCVYVCVRNQTYNCSPSGPRM